jgi:hypothetical protein
LSTNSCASALIESPNASSSVSAGVGAAVVVTMNTGGNDVVVAGGEDVVVDVVDVVEVVVAAPGRIGWSLTSSNSYTPGMSVSSVRATTTRSESTSVKHTIVSPTSRLDGSVQE